MRYGSVVETRLPPDSPFGDVLGDSDGLVFVAAGPGLGDDETTAIPTVVQNSERPYAELVLADPGNDAVQKSDGTFGTVALFPEIKSRSSSFARLSCSSF